jgi:serine protease Do
MPPEAPLLLALRGGAGTQSFLGVAVAEVDAARARDLKLGEIHGVEITRMDEDTAAVKAGLKVGDVVLEYNGQRVEGTEQFIRMVRETPAGREVKLLISRGGATQTVAVTMGSRKAGVMITRGGAAGNGSWFDMGDIQREIQIPDIPSIVRASSSHMLGIEVESLTKQLGEFFGAGEGVLVRSVIAGSPAEKAGIKAGDIIVKVEQTAVTTPGELSSAVRASRSKGTIALDTVRDKHSSSVTVTLGDSAGQPAKPKARAVRM